MEKKNKGLIFLCIVLFFLAIGLGGFIVYDKILNSNNNENKKNDNVRLLTNEEAIIEGKMLYDKATEIYETWILIPYCGGDINSIMKQDNIEKLGSDACMNGRYYKSDFSSLDNLKEYLKRWLSEDIVNDKVFKTSEYNGKTYYNYVEDYSLLSDCDNYASVDYVLKDNTLYCRLDIGKGWISLYDGYDMKVDAIEENKIIYTITSAYVKGESNCYLGLIDSKPCSEEDLEYKDTKFIIEKNESGNFIVTEFTLHD